MSEGKSQEGNLVKRNIIKLFESRKGHLDYRIKRDYISNGIATIPCRISDYSDVISGYSVKGCETLNPDFVDYVKEAADVTPPEYPLVLNIIEGCLRRRKRLLGRRYGTNLRMISAWWKRKKNGIRRSSGLCLSD
ncbi:MAG: hypothetical protein K5985_08070 [Lachnospiraceae bacterium]|nr:hypothetical protein [Lachnospiraceae bacterium]